MISERTHLTIIVIILLITCGYGLFASDSFITRSKISFNNGIVSEQMTMVPGQDYRNLYRFFDSPINYDDGYGYITIDSVSCSYGSSYYNDYHGTLNTQSDMSLFYMTEPNEYGCALGNVYGFKSGSTYTVSGNYELHPSTVFNSQGLQYTKFVLYSSGKHPMMFRGDNLILSNNIISKSFYLPSEDVIVFVPYSGSNVVYSSGAVSFYYPWFNVILALLPAMILILIWYFFGKENLSEDVPDYFSQIPNEKVKPWEVAAFFDPPFSEITPNFFSGTMMDFYNRNIINIKNVSDRTYVKILKTDDLDDIESKFMEMLKIIEKNADKDSKGYFCMTQNIIGRMTSISTNIQIKSVATSVKGMVGVKSGEYMDKTGVWVFTVFAVLVFFIARVVSDVSSWIYLIGVIIVVVWANKTSLLIKYKGTFYRDYQQWQGFKKYLKSLPSIKTSPPQAKVLWEKYLVYGTALGVSSEVLKALRNWKIITPGDEQFYVGTIRTTTTYSGFSNSSSGGHGGLGGGGGVGGGGGGGR